MSEYLHGAYGEAQGNGYPVSNEAASVMVAVGTAPVNQVALKTGESYAVNKPVLVRNIAEAKAAFGYSDDWAKYTLCEVMHHFLENKGVGPLVLINVLDPDNAAHKASTAVTATKTPANGQIILTSAEDAILDSLVITTSGGSPTTKEKGVDYTVAYNASKKQIVVTSIGNGLGTAALTLTYNAVDPSGVDQDDIIGATDNAGANTGVYAVRNVYPMTGRVPAYIITPGWSELPAVHNALAIASRQIGKHWDAWLFTDIPIVDASSNPVTMANAKTWKDTNGYTLENETVNFPMAEGTDGKKYHMSTLRAANHLELLLDNDGIPYQSASNTEAGIIAKLWLGSADTNVYDDEIINENLNKNGIASAAFIGGRWALWGAHAANYGENDQDVIGVAETARMMMFYISNDFQIRKTADVDKPISRNDLISLAAEEQSRLDALVNMGALLYGRANISAEAIERSDVLRGDFAFEFSVTTMPLAKSLKAYVTWVDDGYAVFFADENA